MIEKTNVIGGTNVIAVPSAAGNKPAELNHKKIIETFEITQPLESYGIENSAVSHYVSTIEKGKQNNPGTRSVILIDYQQTVVADVNE